MNGITGRKKKTETNNFIFECFMRETFDLVVGILNTFGNSLKF